jgi:hypothetical protein
MQRAALRRSVPIQNKLAIKPKQGDKMVFLFQMQKIQQKEQAVFRPAKTYSLDLSKAIWGEDSVTAVQQKTVKYLEYALRSNGVDMSKFTASVGGKVLNDVASQSTINRLVKEYNTHAPGEKIPEFEKLPQLSSKEVSAAIYMLLSDAKSENAKYEKIKNAIPKKTRV